MSGGARIWAALVRRVEKGVFARKQDRVELRIGQSAGKLNATHCDAPRILLARANALPTILADVVRRGCIRLDGAGIRSWSCRAQKIGDEALSRSDLSRSGSASRIHAFRYRSGTDVRG